MPGQTLLHDGLRIGWPDVPPGRPDNVVAERGDRRVAEGRRVRVRTPAGYVPARLQLAPLYDPQRLRILDQ